MTTTVIVDACRFISKLKCTFDRARLFRALVIRIFPSQVSLRRMFWLNFVQPRKNIGKPDTGQRLLKAFPKSRWLEPDEWAGRVLVALVEDGRLLHDFFLAEVKAPSEFDCAVGLLQNTSNYPGGGGGPASRAVYGPVNLICSGTRPLSESIT